MPRRTNPFQRLIKQIYDQLMGPGRTVEESAMLPERSNGSPREVDILLTEMSFGVPIQIAVECRKWSIKNDVTWIDGLIGKYKDLQIDKIVAVSATDFTPLALAKAEANGLDALTLREALDTDWTQEFIKLGMLQVEQSFEPAGGSVVTDPPFGDVVAEASPLYAGDGKLLGTFNELCLVIVDAYRPQIGKACGQQLCDGTRTVADIPNTVANIEVTQAIDTPLFLKRDGNRYQVKSVTLRLVSKFSHTIMPVDHKVLGNLRVSTTEMIDADTGTVFEVRAVQEGARPRQAKMSVRPIEQKKKRAPKKES